MNHIAVVTCEGAHDPDNSTLFSALADIGLEASLVVWDDPAVQWDEFDLTVVRSTWDYTDRRDEFLRWAKSVPRLFNRADVIEYSSDKHYLSDLEHRGLRIIPSHFCEMGEEAEFFGVEFVVKPTVGAGSRRVERYRPDESGLARAHVAELHAQGHDALVQPYINSVDTLGERALIFIDGQYSHAMRKGPLLNVAAEGRHFEYRRQQMSLVDAEADAIDYASGVLSAIGRSDLLYARVDLVATIKGWLVMELELIEPALFLTYHEPAAHALAAGISRRLGERSRDDLGE